jgi:hypothetical protein
MKHMGWSPEVLDNLSAKGKARIWANMQEENEYIEQNRKK